MTVYNENNEIITEYDLTLGRLEKRYRTEHHDEQPMVEEEFHYEVLRTYPNGGKDVQKVFDVVGIPYKPAWDEEVPYDVYIPYTEEELAAIEEEKNRPTLEDRLNALEAEVAILKSYINSIGKTELIGEGTEANPFVYANDIDLIPNAFYSYDGHIYVYMGEAMKASSYGKPDEAAMWARWDIEE